MTVATKLSEARKLIERGWCQGSFSKETPTGLCYCADGAMVEVSSGDYAKMCRVFESALGTDHVGMWGWNDAPGRTQAEVIEAFKRAEQLARDSAE